MFLEKQITKWLMLPIAGVVLVGMDQARLRLEHAASEAESRYAWLEQTTADDAYAIDQIRALRDDRGKDLAAVKEGLAKLTQSRQSKLETGIRLQEEKRLLEKQIEILTTYLLIDVDAEKVNVMNGGQALVSYPMRADPDDELPHVMRIISKERYAHPEPGKYEEVDGKVHWEPPQAGTSVRANALGQYVLFTDGPLIIHGPPKKPEEHDKYEHACLHLDLAVAKRLYEKTFIGSKILVKKSSKSEDEAKSDEEMGKD
jgi:hypothetical protein